MQVCCFNHDLLYKINYASVYVCAYVCIAMDVCMCIKLWMCKDKQLRLGNRDLSIQRIQCFASTSNEIESRFFLKVPF